MKGLIPVGIKDIGKAPAERFERPISGEGGTDLKSVALSLSATPAFSQLPTSSQRRPEVLSNTLSKCAGYIRSLIPARVLYRFVPIFHSEERFHKTLFASYSHAILQKDFIKLSQNF